jgi:hypothetical protein
MKTRLFAIALAIAPMTAIALPTAVAAQSRADEARFRAAERRFNYERELFDRERARYEASRRGGYGGGYGGGGGGYREREYGDDAYDRDYDAVRYYRDDPRYQERVLTADDRVYRGSDGRYYCRRSDGTTGLVIGAGAGALLGRAIDGGRSRAGGTIVGGVLGALLGREVERSSDLRCR